MHSILPSLVFLLMIILAAVWLWESSAFKNCLLDLLVFWRQFTRMTRVVIFVGMTGFVICGGSKPTAQSTYMLDTSEAGLTISSVPSNMTSGASIDLTDFELAMESTLISTQSCLAGFALIKASTNSSSWFSDPQNEVVYDRWQRYGVSEDSFYLTLTNSGFSFPLGSNIYSAVHIASQGLLAFGGPQSMARAALDPLLSEAFLAPMNGIASIVPAEGGSLSYCISPTNFVVTWSNLYACRTNQYPLSYQAELKDSGDFSYRFAFSSNFVNSSVATNFNVAAFNHGNGERYSFDATNSGATVRELHWKAFLPVEPGVLDHDGDGLSSAAELFYYGTDISKSDTDGDGVSDYDEVINPAVYDPLNPDSDGDSLVDSMDPQPGIYNDPSAVDPVDGYTLGFKIANLGPAGAVMSFATDSDGDGFEDWKELLAGTLINDASSRPVADDGVATLFSATITLASTLPEPVLLTLGGRRVMLREPGSTTLWLNEGVANTLSLRAVHGCDVSGLSIAVDSSYASYAGDDKPFNGTVRLRSGEQTKFSMVVQPVVSTASNWICFHDEPTRNARAFVLPEDCPGNPEWAENGSNFTIADSGSMNAILNWYGAPGCDHLYFEYCLPGAAARRNAYVHVTRCAGHGSSTSSESSSAAVALNNDDDNGNGTDDRSDSTVEGENDLYESRPIYGHAQSCCPHYGYGPNPDIIATRTHCSGRVRTFTSPSKTTEKTAAFPGDSVFVEGREASPSVGAEKIVWSWSEEGEAKASTNYYTVFSVCLFGDYNFDGAINSVDYAAANNLTEHGWPMLVASNMFHKVELKTDVLIPGYKILSLAGGANIRIWTTPNPTINDTPLLITGQTVTNGFGGASFGASPISMLYVEALDGGVAALTYSYVGTGSTEGFGCSAALGITAVNVELEPVTTETNAQGLILNPCGVATGGLAMYRVSIEPVDAVPDADIHWNVVSGGVTFYGGHDTGREVTIQGGAAGSDFKLEVQIGGLPESCRPYIHGRVLVPRTVQIRAYVICDANGTEAVSENTINGWITEANRIYRQVAVTFTLAGINTITTRPDWFEINSSTEFYQMCSYVNNTDGLELYCVGGMSTPGLHSDMRLASGDPRRGMALRQGEPGQVLAHELGHACGLDHVEYTLCGLVSRELLLEENWSGGDGTGHYPPSLDHKDLVKRILMYPFKVSSAQDIPLGSVKGSYDSGGVVIVSPKPCGFTDMVTREPIH